MSAAVVATGPIPGIVAVRLSSVHLALSNIIA